MNNFDKEAREDKLDSFRTREQEHLAKRLADKNGLSYADLSTVFIKNRAVSLIPEEEAREGHLVVFDKVNKNIKIAVLSPKYEKTREIIKDLKDRGFKPEIFVVSEKSLEYAWKIYEDIKYIKEKEAGSFDISEESISKYRKQLKKTEDIKEQVKEMTGGKSFADTSSILELVLAGALSLGASDIHFEPKENDLRLRYRIDGSLIDISFIPPKIYSKILSRVKLLSGLKLNVANEAQDGRFSIKISQKSIEMRTSIIPGSYGESIVLRILDPDNINVPLEGMGMRNRMFNVFLEEIHKPNGMILTTGPTGSGKTTTLYASLKKIYDPEKKILTIENPVEYHLEGIVQTQTNSKKGYTFSEGLRSALRQDPDVIMVGEIRDEETAEIAVNAALTGHLVFSTLHTNNAAGTFPRLIDLGINDKTLSSAVNLSMAQRLVRKLCPECKRERKIERNEKEIFHSILEPLGYRLILEILEDANVFDPVGCEKCHGMGYKGRTGVFEAIRMDENIEKVVINNPSERDIKKAARGQGIPDMRQDCVLKVLEGITSFKEISGIVALQ
ncbi:MAG: GspE/PulE family protein [Patescibacteria group bacterium]